MKKIPFVAWVLWVTLASHAAGLKPDSLRCDYAVNPLGVDSASPRLFWTVESKARGQKQTACQILVASSLARLKQDRGDLWDSGKVASDETIQVPYAGQPLSSWQQVFWKVRVWDVNGQVSAWSRPATWTMGVLQPGDWRAKWIAAPATNCETLLLRRDFTVKPGLRRALVNVCGLGQYELTLNGKKAGLPGRSFGAEAGDDVLAPGWTKYNQTCLYDTRDITSLLRRGKNAAGLLLGNGMYHVVQPDTNRFTKFKGSFGPLKAIAQIRLEYADGSVEIIGTDDQWHVAPGPITFGSIFGGEDFDARRVPAGWDQPGVDGSQWESAAVVDGPGGVLKGLSCAAPPIRGFEVHRPVATQTLTNGDVVYDLGQNAHHVLQIRVSGPAGSRVSLFPAELTNSSGFVDQSSMGAGRRGRFWCTFTKGTDGAETWSPKFWPIGCRYVQVHLVAAGRAGSPLPAALEKVQDGAHGVTRPTNASTAKGILPKIKSLSGIVAHADSPPAGEFECSNPLFNRIRLLVRWAQRNNTVSIFTDCPHRERLGWLEETHLNGPALRYEFNHAQLFTKTLNDIADSQLDNGLIPTTAPEYTVFKGGFRDSLEWAAAAILVPWQQYEFHGDKELLRRHYDVMKKYVAYLDTTATNNIVNHGLGDWYDLGTNKPGLPQLTPIALTATAFYFYDYWVLSQIAGLLGKTDDAARFERRAEEIYAAFNREFFNPANGTYATGSQCANAVPLVMGLVDPTNRAAVLDAIVRDVRAHTNALTAGDVGYRYLLRALADGGRSDVIFDMNNQSDKPGYGYQLAQGATALTEAWNARRGSSQDHFMLGQIQEWFYHDLAGIGADLTGPGFKKIIIHPQPVGDVTWVKASYDSIRGKIVSDWQRDGDRFKLSVTIPANTTARVYVPAKSADAVTESGRPATLSDGVVLLWMENGRAVFAVESGKYRFESKL
jgi:alpha-L-rhamnosidase